MYCCGFKGECEKMASKVGKFEKFGRRGEKVKSGQTERIEVRGQKVK